jgi:hypothetical protein
MGDGATDDLRVLEAKRLVREEQARKERARISLTKDGQRLSALESEVSWLRRKLGRAVRYIEDNEHIEKRALSFVRHVRKARPDLPKFDGGE